MHTRFVDDSSYHLILKKFIALCFCNVFDVRDRYRMLARQLLDLFGRTEQHQEFLDYFENTWVGRSHKDPRFPISMWNCKRVTERRTSPAALPAEETRGPMRLSQAACLLVLLCLGPDPLPAHNVRWAKGKKKHGMWYKPDPYTRCKVSPENVSAALEYFTKDELQCSGQGSNQKDVISVMLDGEETSRVPVLECIVNVRALDGASVCVDLDCSENSSDEPVPLSLGWISSSKKLFSTS
ncbi:hypothetical protein HPB47_008510 [Ixodes persulcatus]|uniref:Uncharacterized protein n=1 Tax=Ixodes persulcatus TaxID=34615 RepID=A0AC60P4H0_IXOPE|nr:hypothetical protein HPB47_008510 [Ixodes persulcatus]